MYYFLFKKLILLFIVVFIFLIVDKNCFKDIIIFIWIFLLLMIDFEGN